MKRSARVFAILCGSLIFAAGSSATFAQSSIPIRTLAPVEAATLKPVRAMLGDVRETPTGNVIVNDAIARQLLLFDRSLQSFSVLRDSIAGLENSYGPRASFLLPYLADSALFVDLVSQTLVVVTPEGAFKRAMAIPNPRDVYLIAAPGTSADALGRLIYRGEHAPKAVAAPGAPAVVERVRDSVPLLRADFDARRVDTIARLKVVAADRRIITGEGKDRRQQTIVNPLHSIDDWASLSNGKIAIVRGYDYHVEWIDAKDQHTPTAKLPFAWRQLTDTEKERLIDSARTFRNTQDSALMARIKSDPKFGTRIEIREGRNVEVPDQTTYVTNFVPLKEIPDYYPPLRSGATRADRDNNLWILPTTTVASLNGELVYDVINQNGELFQRVRVPAGRSIAGFGKGGVVYLMYRVADKGWFIERTRILR